MAKNKFWEFKNVVNGFSADLYIYSEISSWDVYILITQTL